MSIIRSLDETKLRSIKFSQFSSKEPLVQKGLNTKLEDGIGLKQQLSKREDDFTRISRLLVSGPGLKFIQNTGILSLAENRAKFDPNRPFRSLLNTVVGTGKSVASVLAAILAQVPVSGTGIHFSADIIAGSTYLAKDSTTRLKSGQGNFVRGEGFPTLVKSSEYGYRTDELQQLKDQFSPLVNNPVDVKPSETLLSPEIGYTAEKLQEFDQVSYETDYNIDVRLKRGKTLGKLTAGTIFGQDELNYLTVQTQQSELGETSDIIPFKFVIVSSDETKYYIYLRAYLESFNDNFNGTWNGTKYIGRAEEFYNYTGFSRNINFAFKVAATSKSELLPLYQKLNFLAGTTSPEYRSNYMNAVYVELTIGDYVNGLPGFITSLDIKWDQNYPWEINQGVPDGNSPVLQPDESRKLPHILDVSAAFIPIHKFSPTFRKPFFGNFDVQNFTVDGKNPETLAPASDFTTTSGGTNLNSPVNSIQNVNVTKTPSIPNNFNTKEAVKGKLEQSAKSVKKPDVSETQKALDKLSKEQKVNVRRR